MSDTKSEQMTLERIRAALPARFVERLDVLLDSGDRNAVLTSFAQEQSVCFRTNTLVTNTQALADELRREALKPVAISWLSDAFVLPATDRRRLLSSRACSEGRLYVQNLSSMLPPVVLSPLPGERVLDLAAAPGSKTHQIVCMMEDRGEIAAVERVRSRYYKLRDNMNRLGVSSVRILLRDGSTVWRNRPGYFDRVLVDAPCSSEGRFRVEDPETFSYWSPRKIREMVRKQSRLLFSGIKCLRPGGVLVYSTCSFAPEENEGVVARMIDQFGVQIEIEEPRIALPNMRDGLTAWKHRRFPAQVARCRRVLPTSTMEGFFLCRIKKTERSHDADVS
jgi:16S rRNA (cytosine1407-C5)-methyltransferase